TTAKIRHQAATISLTQPLRDKQVLPRWGGPPGPQPAPLPTSRGPTKNIVRSSPRPTSASAADQEVRPTVQARPEPAFPNSVKQPTDIESSPYACRVAAAKPSSLRKATPQPLRCRRPTRLQPDGFPESR